MLLLNFPNEILEIIAHSITSDRDLNNFTRTCHQLYAISNTHLYKRDRALSLQRAFWWAARHRNLATARKSLAAGIPPPQVLVGLMKEAAKFNSVAVLELLFQQKGVDVGTVYGFKGRTLLMKAAASGARDVVSFLLSRGDVDVNARDDTGMTALSIVIEYRDWCSWLGYYRITIIEPLLAHPGVDVNLGDIRGFTPLIWAIKKLNLCAVKMLLAVESIDVNLSAMAVGRDHTAVEMAAFELRDRWDSSGKEEEGTPLEILQLLLERPDTSVDFDNGSSVTSIYWSAAQNGDEGLFRLLLAKGGKTNPMTEQGLDLFSQVARCGHAGVLKVMLEYGVHPDTPTQGGRTSLSHAAEQGHLAVMEALVGTGKVAIDAQDDEGRTPLWWALNGGCYRVDEAVEFLVVHGAVDATFGDKDTLRSSLEDAIKAKSSLSSEVLLEQGRQESLLTPQDERDLLSLGIRAGTESFIKQLLAGGSVDLNSMDRDGRTVIGWAAVNDRVDILDILLSQPGIDPNVTDRNEATGLLHAIRRLRKASTLPGGAQDPRYGCQISFIEKLLAHPAVTTDRIPKDILMWILFEFARRNKLIVVELLIRMDSRLNHNATVNGRKRETIVAWAKSNRHPDLARLLLERRVPIWKRIPRREGTETVQVDHVDAEH